jgi:hypothetical protein
VKSGEGADREDPTPVAVATLRILERKLAGKLEGCGVRACGGERIDSLTLEIPAPVDALGPIMIDPEDLRPTAGRLFLPQLAHELAARCRVSLTLDPRE